MPNKTRGQKDYSKEKSNVTMTHLRPPKKSGGNNAKSSLTRAKFLRAYELSYGNVSYSCEQAGIGRKTFYRWMKSTTRVNKKFQKRLELIKPVERQLDFIEAKLMERVAAGDTAAIIFAAKTLGRKRGYGEKVSISEYDQVIKAVERLQKVFQIQTAKNPEWKFDLRKY
ncbi:MAG TPA: hypothetical protein PKY82_01855, partial [Pyrinomonadaceae bacterium]|nr:hypothetical protein [Pyrinomonadaceae bacterium]